MVEINQLAIINMTGIDFDPKTKKLKVYYHIINPKGITAKPGVDRAPFYSFHVEGSNTSQIISKANNVIGRNLFPDHYQAIVVTDRFAKAGIKNTINFHERQVERRSFIHLFVTESPLEKIMKTYMTLDKLEGTALRALAENQAKEFGTVSKFSRMKDIAENMETSATTFLPIVGIQDSNQPNAKRYEEINANLGNLVLTGGAIMKKDQMIGRLGLSDMKSTLILRGENERFYNTLHSNGKMMDIQSINTKVNKKLTIEDGTPIWKVNLYTELRILDNNLDEPLTLQNQNKVKERYKKFLIKQLIAIYEKGKKQNWDLFDLEATLQRSQGKEWKNMHKKDSWKKIKLDLEVNCKFIDVGEIIDPYKGKGS